MDFDWKSLVKTVAPGLATALGGPLAGIAVKALGDSLLGDSTASVDQVSQAVLNATPDQLLALKNADAKFQTDMAALGVDVFKIEVDDRKDARNRAIQMHDFSPNFIGLVIICFWGFINYTMLTMDSPPKVGDMTTGRILGMIDAATMAFLYWMYGGSKTGDSAVRKLS